MFETSDVDSIHSDSSFKPPVDGGGVGVGGGAGGKLGSTVPVAGARATSASALPPAPRPSSSETPPNAPLPSTAFGWRNSDTGRTWSLSAATKSIENTRNENARILLACSSCDRERATSATNFLFASARSVQNDCC